MTTIIGNRVPEGNMMSPFYEENAADSEYHSRGSKGKKKRKNRGINKIGLNKGEIKGCKKGKIFKAGSHAFSLN